MQIHMMNSFFLLLALVTNIHAGPDSDIIDKAISHIQNGKVEEATKICESLNDDSKQSLCRGTLKAEQYRINEKKRDEKVKLVDAKWNSLECKRAQASVGFCDVKSALKGYTEFLTNKNLTESNRNALLQALDHKAADQLRRLISMKNIGMKTKEIDCKTVLENPPTGLACYLKD